MAASARTWALGCAFVLSRPGPASWRDRPPPGPAAGAAIAFVRWGGCGVGALGHRQGDDAAHQVRPHAEDGAELAGHEVEDGVAIFRFEVPEPGVQQRGPVRQGRRQVEKPTSRHDGGVIEEGLYLRAGDLLTRFAGESREPASPHPDTVVEVLHVQKPPVGSLSAIDRKLLQCDFVTADSHASVARAMQGARASNTPGTSAGSVTKSSAATASAPAAAYCSTVAGLSSWK